MHTSAREELEPGESRPRSRWLVRLALLLGSGLVALVLAEVVLRSRLPAATEYFIWEPSFERVFRPRIDLIQGVEGDSHFVTNALGLRGDELASEHGFRVLALGGSTTECLILHQTEAWPRLVQGLLDERQERHGVWVGNGGVSGLNCREHVLQLRHTLSRIPELDLVMVLVGVNDLLFPLAQGEDYDPEYASQPGAEAALLSRAFRVLPLGRAEGVPFYKRTALYRAAGVVRDRLFPTLLVQDETDTILQTWRDHRASASRVIDAMPDLRPALEEYRRNLGSVIDLCEQAGVRLLFLTQPSMWAEGMPAELERLLWMGGVGEYQQEPGCAYYSPGALAEGMRRYNEVLIEVAESRGVEWVDIAPLVPRDTSALYDDVHFNEAGSRLVAEVVAAYLLSRPPFQ